MRRTKHKIKISTGLLTTVVVLLVTMGVSSQNSKALDIMHTYAERLKKNQEYQVDITYKIYKGLESKEAHETMSGVLYKKQGNTYSKIGESEIVSTSSKYLKINHKEKAMLITDSVQQLNQFDIDLTELYKYVDVKILEETDRYFKLEFTPKGAITQLPFSSLIISMNRDSYLITRQTFHYYSNINFSKDYRNPDLSKFKLEVSYNNYKTRGFTVSNKVFNINRYVRESKEEIIVSPQYKGYELVNM